MEKFGKLMCGFEHQLLPRMDHQCDNSLLPPRMSYDVFSRQHWLSVYKPKFNARYLLKQGKYETQNPASDEAKSKVCIGTQTVEKQIRAAVDQMIREVPPPPVMK